jgi:glycine hydroxymethyltransferase
LSVNGEHRRREDPRERLSQPDVRDVTTSTAVGPTVTDVGRADYSSIDGIAALTGGIEVHLVLVDLRNADIDGQQAEDRLAAIGITLNRNVVPLDPRPPMVTSGLRIGIPALAARGFLAEDFAAVADLIAKCLIAAPDAETAKLARAVDELAERHPLYPQL